mmetsp:Transcript_13458/g.52761  ORF Transcript_13458/g.52761 Transcript_13458/m.52761 type:complete len:207 (-) Transcript_13458:1001-1621(-)
MDATSIWSNTDSAQVTTSPSNSLSLTHMDRLSATSSATALRDSNSVGSTLKVSWILTMRLASACCASTLDVRSSTNSSTCSLGASASRIISSVAALARSLRFWLTSLPASIISAANCLILSSCWPSDSSSTVSSMAKSSSSSANLAWSSSLMGKPNSLMRSYRAFTSSACAPSLSSVDSRRSTQNRITSMKSSADFGGFASLLVPA